MFELWSCQTRDYEIKSEDNLVLRPLHRSYFVAPTHGAECWAHYNEERKRLLSRIEISQQSYELARELVSHQD